MASDGKASAKPERKLGKWMWRLAPLTIIMLLGLRSHLYDFGYDLWSRCYIAPQLSRAEEATKADHSDKALAEALPILRRHPDNPRLLYFAAGAYWDLGQLPLAAFYARAYLLSPRAKDPVHVDTLGKLLAADPDAWPYFKATEAGPAPPNAYAWMRFLNMSAEAKAGLAAHFEESPSSIDSNLKLCHAAFYGLPLGWQKVILVKPAALLTQPSDVAEDDGAGLVNIDGSVLCGDSSWCAPFEHADLWGAVSTGRLTIDYPKGGDGCCTLSLDDPDLRPLDQITAEFLARRQAAGKGPPEDSAEGSIALIGLQQRVLLKQSYLLSFVAGARGNR